MPVNQVGGESTREKIKTAAAEIFIEKGYAAARMQEIADRAQANKAMIYYYFSSKDALFESIIREAFEELFSMFTGLQQGPECDLPTLIARLVHTHFHFLQTHPQLPRLIARELNSDNPIPQKVLTDVIRRHGKERLESLQNMLSRAISDGRLRSVDVKHTLWNIVSLNVFTFIVSPVFQNVWPEEYKNSDRLMKKREKAIVDLILYGILPRKG